MTDPDAPRRYVARIGFKYADRTFWPGDPIPADYVDAIEQFGAMFAITPEETTA
jgi:hypothetical protein